MDDVQAEINKLTQDYWIDRGMYFDRQGNSMTMIEWAQMFENSTQAVNLRRVIATKVRHIWVSTVWLGLNHEWRDGPPLIFETMMFNRHKRDRNKHSGRFDFCDRYSTEEQARRGHHRVVQVLKARGIQGLAKL